MSDALNEQVRSAARWSILSEAASKLVTPLTQLMLARILAPEAFGVLASVVMVVSFAEMLSDAGFHKYLIQYEFADRLSLYRSANVAFWSSMAVALILLLVIVCFRDHLASMIGAHGLGVPLAITALSLPLSVIAGTQQALFRRDFEYKKLLPVRLTVAITPLLVSLPLALNGYGYWSLIAGVVAANFINGLAMTRISSWKPSFFFSFALLKSMFSFSIWSLLEAVSIWVTVWSGAFIVGNVLSSNELGLYRQPILVVNSVFAVITSATTPILFAALSRLSSSKEEYRRFFLHFQFLVGIILFPVGVGAFFYREFFTEVLFGGEWSEASLMFGTWSLSSSFSIVLAHYCSEVFRSLGKPRVSLLSQMLYLLVMVPTLYFAALDGFTTLVVASALVRVAAIIIGQVLTYIVAGIGPFQVVRNLYAPFIAVIVMGCTAAWFSSLANGNWGWSFLGVFGCALIYVSVCLCIPRTRAVVVNMVLTVVRRARASAA